MSLESFGVEALQGVLRRLVQDLSDPTLFDFDTQAVAGSSAEQSTGPQPFEVASNGFGAALSPEQWPGDAVENPREYLDYLLDKVEADQQALEDWYAEVIRRQPVVWTPEGPVTAQADVGEAVKELIDLKKDIIAARKGAFPPSQEKLSEFYDRLMSVRRGALA